MHSAVCVWLLCVSHQVGKPTHGLDDLYTVWLHQKGNQRRLCSGLGTDTTLQFSAAAVAGAARCVRQSVSVLSMPAEHHAGLPLSPPPISKLVRSSDKGKGCLTPRCCKLTQCPLNLGLLLLLALAALALHSNDQASQQQKQQPQQQ